MITNNSQYNNSRYINATTMAVVILSLMYSFGTFGFLNLFGARSLVQAVLLGVITLLFIVMRVNFRINHLITILVFSVTYIAGSLIFQGRFSSLLDIYILIFCFVLFFYSSPKNLVFFSKALVVVTTFLSSLVAIAFIYYYIYPEELFKANFVIYGSEVGSSRVYPGNFMDFISFTSGEGFEVMGQMISRMKGYSNEPSSTIVHYVAPAAMAFILGGRFIYLGVFILVINAVAIISFTTYIILILSFAFFIIKFIPKIITKILFFLVICSFLYLILNPAFVLSMFIYFSSLMMDAIGLDFLSRKIGDGTTDSNLGQRHEGIITGLKLALISPLGYSQSKLGAGAGLFYLVSSRAGWVGILIFGTFLISFIKNIRVTYFRVSSLSYLYGVSLLLSVLLVTLFISGYGWSRPPGIIMILLYFRFLQIVEIKDNALLKCLNGKFFIESIPQEPRKIE